MVLCVPDAQADDSIWGKHHVVFCNPNLTGVEAMSIHSVLVIFRSALKAFNLKLLEDFTNKSEPPKMCSKRSDNI